ANLGCLLGEKQISQVIENLESGGESKEPLETAALRPRQGALPGCATPRLSNCSSHSSLRRPFPGPHRAAPTEMHPKIPQKTRLDISLPMCYPLKCPPKTLNGSSAHREGNVQPGFLGDFERLAH